MGLGQKEELVWGGRKEGNVLFNDALNKRWTEFWIRTWQKTRIITRVDKVNVKQKMNERPG